MVCRNEPISPCTTMTIYFNVLPVIGWILPCSSVIICVRPSIGEQNQLIMSEQILNYLTKTDNTYSENTYNATKDLYTVYIYWAIPCNITSSCSKGIQQNLNRFINVVNSNWVFYIINFSNFFYHSYVNCELCLWYQSSINTKYPWWNMYMT